MKFLEAIKRDFFFIIFSVVMILVLVYILYHITGVEQRCNVKWEEYTDSHCFCLYEEDKGKNLFLPTKIEEDIENEYNIS